MGITLSNLQSMLVPLHSVMAWLARTPAPTQRASSPPFSTAETRRTCGVSAPPRRHHARPGRALRVVGVLEGQAAPRGAGRMVISGRMADVCAELDRLAALEAAAP